jgi:hypothetical protein
MYDYEAAFNALISDPRYLTNLDWGEPRPGHPEAAVRAHITELEGNLEQLRPRLAPADFWRLKLLIHTHDTFKAGARPGASITDPQSHASLARAFLAAYCPDPDLLAMCQFHDEPYALWRQVQTRGTYNAVRMQALLAAVRDWNLFLAFNLVDGCTAGKTREPLRWLFRELVGKVNSSFTEADIIEP